jgi:hypothetical protein
MKIKLSGSLPVMNSERYPRAAGQLIKPAKADGLSCWQRRQPTKSQLAGQRKLLRSHKGCGDTSAVMHQGVSHEVPMSLFLQIRDVTMSQFPRILKECAFS